MKPCLTNLVTFCAGVTVLGAEGTAVVVSASVSRVWVSRAGPEPSCRAGFRVWALSGTSLVLGVVLAPAPEAHYWWTAQPHQILSGQNILELEIVI